MLFLGRPASYSRVCSTQIGLKCQSTCSMRRVAFRLSHAEDRRHPVSQATPWSYGFAVVRGIFRVT